MGRKLPCFESAIMMNRWVLFAAPHRGMFAGGMLQTVMVMVLWLIDIGGRHAGLWPMVHWADLPSPWLHALLMIYGIFPFFIFGFIHTAGPRWAGMGELTARQYVPAFLMMAAGWILFYTAGLFSPLSRVIAFILIGAGWAWAVIPVWGLVRHAWVGKAHLAVVATALTLGVIGFSLMAWAIASGQGSWADVAIMLGIWMFLLPVFFTVSFRMLPFFSGAVIPGYQFFQPLFLYWIVVAGLFGHGLLELVGWSLARGVLDAIVAANALHLSWRWAHRQAVTVRLLSVLHVAFAWFGVAMTLFALDGLLASPLGMSLGWAPLHALTIGYLMSTGVGMVSRVSRGHSGQPLIGDPVMWSAFWILQATAVMRIAAEWLPGTGWANPYLVSATLWILGMSTWAGRYAPVCWRPRPDGRPG